MEGLINVMVFVQQYVSAIRRGLETTALMLPGLIEQHIDTQAKEKLHSSRSAYMDAVKVTMEDYLLIVEMDEDNWLACAVEQGKDSWDMNQTHLNSAKTKISKSGYRYLNVPIGKEAGGKAGPSEKSKRIQEKINQVMKRPKIVPDRMGNMSRLYTQYGSRLVPGVFPAGAIMETQRIETSDQEISGLYRTRSFANSEEYFDKKATKKGMPAWTLVMFRTMSENPLSKHWIHPGIKGVGIFKETEQWANGIIGPLLDQNIQTELAKIK